MNRGVAALCLGVAVLSVVAGAQTPGPATGGDTTVADESVHAFGRALANLDATRWSEFRAGKARFVREWPDHRPFADAISCAECHYRDGRGPRAEQLPNGRSHLLRLGRPSPGADPAYGVQLRRTGYGVSAPGRFVVRWIERRGRYPSGEPYSLRRPRADVMTLAYGPLDRETRLSLRVPPAVFGLGLLEAIDEATISANADPDDANRDGVSGRAPSIPDPLTGATTLGRFGWKAAQPSLAAQSATALREDLGVALDADSHPVTQLVRYLKALAVPGRRRAGDPLVLEGERIFATIGCSSCHRAQVTTGRAPDWPELSHQTIQPYTDLLLHDLGPEMADEVAEGVATGSEWRTPPLWGLGLLPAISGGTGLMHDGRARSPEEAILWHGGEAQQARDRFRALPVQRRQALLEFLATL
jgi:CxxC motif-containing protein (DUF1111 family)